MLSLHGAELPVVPVLPVEPVAVQLFRVQFSKF